MTLKNKMDANEIKHYMNKIKITLVGIAFLVTLLIIGITYILLKMCTELNISHIDNFIAC